MRNGNGILFSAIAVVVVFAGLVAYQQFRRQNDEIAALRDAAATRDEADARLRREVEASREQIAKVAEETAGIRDTLERTPPPAVVTDKGQVAMLGDLTAVSGMRVAIVEAYQTMGALPADNAAAGLPPPERYRGASLVSATVRDGAIELVFDASSGKQGGRIRLVPDVSRIDAMGVQWRCETQDYPDIARTMPSCTYVR
ncbi:pilin [Dokdonella sp. MW10]|uniref:pilin n=1 Tax=Dokdonella sp. MW10 TaxID=2992926 RepID=UPI003F811C54